MKVIHVVWVPQAEAEFIQAGQWGLWVEDPSCQPTHLVNRALADFISEQFNLPLNLPKSKATQQGVICQIELPSTATQPLPSPELAGFVEQPLDFDAQYALQSWPIECLLLAQPIHALNQIHFFGQYPNTEYRLGSDFLFWHRFSQVIRQVIDKQLYLPNLIQSQQLQQSKLKPMLKPKPKPKLGDKTQTSNDATYGIWQIVSSEFEQALLSGAKAMPPVCAQGFEPLSLLRHCAQVSVNSYIRQATAKVPQVIEKKFAHSLLQGFFQWDPRLSAEQAPPEQVEKWYSWQQKLNDLNTSSTIQLCLRLQDPSGQDSDLWTVHFMAASRSDLTFKQDLAEYWALSIGERNALAPRLGGDFEQQILCALGSAARIYPPLWQGMNCQHPTRLSLNVEQAFAFLKETAWVLEDAGFKVMVPAWWTPKGRQRAKIRLRSKSKSKSGASGSESKGLLSLDKLVEYRYELAIGDTPVTEVEWAQLVAAKSSLVEFRGQWMALEPDKMAQMLDFWQQQGQGENQVPLSTLVKTLAEQSEIFELPQQDAMAQMLYKLAENSQLEPIENPPQLNATLRDYQKRGVAWLRYLERLGLNGCLADDMGLGKTIQVIANLVVDHPNKKGPTLLIAPTSVMGNWQKELEKFAPQLTTFIHHGSGRTQDKATFTALCHSNDMVISSYSLVRRDAKLLDTIHWQRVVLDEAQNIKNPKAEQSKAIFKLKSDTRLALTGTPVENRLLDLWSIFNFLNPGYLGSQSQFRKSYELPIQRQNNPTQAAILKQLIAPFILRRMKTDKSIIKDLPDKVDSRQYCNLSKEQAALYEAIVQDVNVQLETKEGIERQGLMLSTLTKLKQICNHPAQFLQDGSPFTPQRSHKLERLTQMLEEAQAEGDSVLIFTQFTEIGDQLYRYLSQTQPLNCYYLHGQVPRLKRESMISAFQDPTSGPAVFILSLKAGGVGITLTQANHVFHFDRWWNPAVEDQATDRAFRIGQQKSVFVHKFITLGTLEERIDQMIEDKKQLAGSIIGTDEGWLAKLDNHAFKSLIALNRQTIME